MTTAHPSDRELLAEVRRIFAERIPFNRLLGVTIEELSFESAKVAFDFREELVGNFIRQSLHGGVISATLDLTGGLMAFVGAARAADGTPEERTMALSRVGTIDLRVDYLRPGAGSHFIATASVLRSGNKVTVARVELVNDEGDLIAVATGAYLTP